MIMVLRQSVIFEPPRKANVGARYSRRIVSPGGTLTLVRALPARRGSTYGTHTRTSCGPASTGTRRG
jgi:hypothetical protein